MINFGGSVFDLEDLELTYAPPYGSAKDPINMAGYVASNFLKGDHPIWHWDEVDEIKKNNSLILDVRTKDEYEIGTIEDAINISDLNLREKLGDLPKDKEIYTFCEVGFRGYIATRVLQQKGFNVKNLSGGYKLFRMAQATPEEIAAACGPPEEIVEELMESKSIATEEFIEVDACGLSCPGPLNAMIKGLETLPKGKKLKIFTTDPGFKSSVEAYSELNEAIKLLTLKKEEGKLIATLEKTEITLEEIKAPVQVIKKSRKDLRSPEAPPLSNISAEELYKRMDSDDSPDIIIDVRTPQEYNSPAGHIKNAKLLPLGDLMQNIDSLEEYKDKEVVLLCHSGSRSMMASQLLARAGFKDVRNLTGGMMLWHRKGYPVEGAIKY